MSEKIFYRNRFDPKGTVILLPRRTADSHVVVHVHVKWNPIIKMNMSCNYIHNFLYIMFLRLYKLLLKKIMCMYKHPLSCSNTTFRHFCNLKISGGNMEKNCIISANIYLFLSVLHMYHNSEVEVIKQKLIS